MGQPLEIAAASATYPSMDVSSFSAVAAKERTGSNRRTFRQTRAPFRSHRTIPRRAASAQGIMSGRILSAIPAIVAGIMCVVNPQYSRFFIDDPVGHQLLAGTVGLQVLGYLIIKKIVTFEV
jgi:tight adherence protein B